MRTWSLIGLSAVLVVAGASVAPAAERSKLDRETDDAVQLFTKTDSKMQRLFETAYGYVVFPKVTKGAAGIGAAEGKGEVVERGVMIGRAKLTQLNVGAQLGGQQYAEVIFFENKEALDEFTDGKLAMSAGVSAVAAASGASADAKYQHGVQVYTIAKNGLMFEASVGGQKFEFMPVRTKGAEPAVAR